MLLAVLLACGSGVPESAKPHGASLEPGPAPGPPGPRVEPHVEADPSGPAPALSAEVIAAVVRKHQGRVVSCLESALLRNPATNGKVSVGWSIQDGRVFDARLVTNTTGDDALIASAVRSMRFPDDVTAEVAEFPWVLSG